MIGHYGTSSDYWICVTKICGPTTQGNKALCNFVRNNAPIICHVINIAGFVVFPKTFFLCLTSLMRNVSHTPEPGSQRCRWMYSGM